MKKSPAVAMTKDQTLRFNDLSKVLTIKSPLIS